MPPAAQSDQPLRRNPLKAAIALSLTFAAGFVDISGALTIYDIFAAHMTGTTVRMGQHLLHRNLHAAGLSAAVLLAFVIGSLIGRVAIEAASRRKFRNVASLTVFLEACLLFAVIWLAPATLAAGDKDADIFLMAMLAVAMGLQTATLTRIGPLTVHTTFVTGMINKFCQLVSHWFFRSYDLIFASGAKGDQLRESRRLIGRQVAFIFSIWLLYFAGACCGTWLSKLLRFHAFNVPFCILLLVIAVDLTHPLSIEEEREQSDR